MTAVWLAEPVEVPSPNIMPGGFRTFGCRACSPAVDFASKDELLAHHAWHVANSTPTVGTQGSGIA